MWHPPACTFYAQGKCVLGKKCYFLHPKDQAAPAAKADAKPKVQPKAKNRANGMTAAGMPATKLPLNQ